MAEQQPPQPHRVYAVPPSIAWSMLVTGLAVATTYSLAHGALAAVWAYWLCSAAYGALARLGVQHAQ